MEKNLMHWSRSSYLNERRTWCVSIYCTECVREQQVKRYGKVATKHTYFHPGWDVFHAENSLIHKSKSQWHIQNVLHSLVQLSSAQLKTCHSLHSMCVYVFVCVYISRFMHQDSIWNENLCCDINFVSSVRNKLTTRKILYAICASVFGCLYAFVCYSQWGNFE